MVGSVVGSVVWSVVGSVVESKVNNRILATTSVRWSKLVVMILDLRKTTRS